MKTPWHKRALWKNPIVWILAIGLIWMIVAVIVARPDQSEDSQTAQKTTQEALTQSTPAIRPYPAPETDPQIEAQEQALPEQERVRKEDKAILDAVSWDDEVAVLVNARAAAKQVAALTDSNGALIVNNLQDLMTESALAQLSADLEAGERGSGPRQKVATQIQQSVLEVDSDTGARTATVFYTRKIGSNPIQHLYVEFEFLPSEPLISKMVIHQA